jgi:hypothetical protein
VSTGVEESAGIPVTSTEAAARLRVDAKLFRLAVRVLKLPRHPRGTSYLVSEDTIRRVDAWFNQVDPGGEFRTLGIGTGRFPAVQRGLAESHTA